MMDRRPRPAAPAIEAWLLERLRARLGPQAEAVEPHLPFSYYGLASIDAVALAGELADWLGEPVPPSLAWDYPTAHAVATHLAGEEASQTAPDEAAAAASATALLAELNQRSEP